MVFGHSCGYLETPSYLLDVSIRASIAVLSGFAIVAPAMLAVQPPAKRVRPTSRRAHSCSYAAASYPRALTDSNGRTALAHAPAVTIAGARAVLVGDDVPWPSRLVPRDRGGEFDLPLVGWQVSPPSVDATRIEGPPVGHAAFFARAASDSAGAIEVVWQRVARIDSAGSRSLRVRRDEAAVGWATEIWSASYERRHWTTPTPLFKAFHIAWGSNGASSIIRDTRGRLHLAFGALYDDGRNVLVHAIWADKRWSIVATDLPSPVVYVALAATPDGQVVAAYIAPVLSNVHDRNSVWFARSDDSGRFTSPLLVRRSGEQGATAPQLLAAPDGALELLWAQNLSGGLTAQALSVTRSTDGGATWSPIEQLGLPDGFSHLRAVIDGCGQLHVTYSDWAAGPTVHSMYLRRTAAGWTKPAELAATDGFDDVVPAILPNGDVMLAGSLMIGPKRARRRASALSFIRRLD
jgi:hypothetical protein